MLNREIFSERLKALRQQKQVTMVDVANVLGLKKQAVHQWETMKNIPSTDTLLALADYFDVSLDYLVGRSDNPEVNK
jgi:transcriptional regulator with XRE-family HTH domain